MCETGAWKTADDFEADMLELSVIQAQEYLRESEKSIALVPNYGRGVKKPSNQYNLEEEYNLYLGPIRGSRERPGYLQDFNNFTPTSGRGQKLKADMERLQNRKFEKDREKGIQNQLNKVYSGDYFSNERIEETYGARSSSASPSVYTSEEEPVAVTQDGRRNSNNGTPSKNAEMLYSDKTQTSMTNGQTDKRRNSNDGTQSKNAEMLYSDKTRMTLTNGERNSKSPVSGILNTIDFPPLP